ncbi:MAG: cytochrome c biogenesis protein CcdA [Deltaproteobacteria bacterium]|jgi:cytochrome c-type biogenesis protein|nr:cytochrome c biogenesis protein CcdA [Deltaproteobacteria bacterium]
MFLDFGALGAIVTQKVSFLGAFLAGLITFFTPCVLPMIPVWMALATGRPAQAPNSPGEKGQGRALRPTLFFVLGFSLVFVALGAAASALGSFLYDRQEILRFGGGIVMIAFGLSLLGLPLPFFAWLEGKRLKLPGPTRGFLGPLVVGLAFAAGWTPCVGPVLGAILAMAALRESLAAGASLLAIYSLGLALPFIGLALLWERLWPRLKRLGRFSRWLSLSLGVALVVLGLLLILGKISLLTFNYPY